MKVSKQENHIDLVAETEDECKLIEEIFGGEFDRNKVMGIVAGKLVVTEDLKLAFQLIPYPKVC